MQRRYFLSLILVHFVFFAIAQNNTSIKGKLIDSLTTEPLAFATLKLESKQTKSLIKGELADDKGSFQFVGLKDDKYVIKIEYVGYKTKYVEISSNNNLSMIRLSNSLTNQSCPPMATSMTIHSLNWRL